MATEKFQEFHLVVTRRGKGTIQPAKVLFLVDSIKKKKRFLMYNYLFLLEMLFVKNMLPYFKLLYRFKAVNLIILNFQKTIIKLLLLL